MQFSLKRLSDFIEAEKNLFIATMLILMAFYITIWSPDNIHAGIWLGLASTGAGVYIGNRIGSAAATAAVRDNQ